MVYKKFHFLNLLDYKIFKFLLIGSSSFLINAGLLELFHLFGLGLHLSTVIATELAIINNFILNSVWTFKDRMEWNSVTNVFGRFIRFNLLSINAIWIETVCVWVATVLIDDTIFVRQCALVVSIVFLVLPLNWFLYNRVVWRNSNLQ